VRPASSPHFRPASCVPPNPDAKPTQSVLRAAPGVETTRAESARRPLLSIAMDGEPAAVITPAAANDASNSWALRGHRESLESLSAIDSNSEAEAAAVEIELGGGHAIFSPPIAVELKSDHAEVDHAAMSPIDVLLRALGNSRHGAQKFSVKDELFGIGGFGRIREIARLAEEDGYVEVKAHPSGRELGIDWILVTLTEAGRTLLKRIESEDARTSPSQAPSPRPRRR